MIINDDQITLLYSCDDIRSQSLRSHCVFNYQTRFVDYHANCQSSLISSMHYTKLHELASRQLVKWRQNHSSLLIAFSFISHVLT